ncbi:MAG: LamG domain-containing protein, partial [Lentisphaerae bacterium]|nr:LamG domain-containing protein [Lentisphaerota bacterium]
NDLYEYYAGTDPTKVITDPVTQGTTNDADWDSDGDGLTHLQEQNLGTMPRLPDTDDDGKSDYDEVTADPASNPLDSLSPHVTRELQLAADGHVDLGDLSSLALREFTIEAWIKPTAAGAILQRRSSVDNRVNYRLEIKPSGCLYLVFDGESFAGAPAAGDKESTSADAAGLKVSLDGDTWTHVAVQLYRKSAYLMSVRFYVNGVDATSADQADFAIAGAWTGRGTADVRIGSDLATLPTMAGSILDLKVWNSGNVAVPANWDRFEPASTSGLVAWYRFDDGPERTITPATHPDGDTNTIENFVHSQDWLTSWEHAARLVNGVIAPADMDGLPEVFIDSDGDGLPDWWEIQYFGNLDRDGTGDYDGDGLTDLYEYYTSLAPNPAYHTDPTKPQTVPGIDDAVLDSDGDGLANGEEQTWGTHPGKPDSDDDGVSDGDEVFGMMVANDGTPSTVRNTNLYSHPLYSMSHYDRNIQDTDVDGVHRRLTPQRALDLSRPAAGLDAAWKGIELPENERFRYLTNGAAFETWLRLTADNLSAADGDYAIIAARNGGNTVLELGYQVAGGKAYLQASFTALDDEVVKVGGS